MTSYYITFYIRRPSETYPVHALYSSYNQEERNPFCNESCICKASAAETPLSFRLSDNSFVISALNVG